ncbi:hypothetical protein [Acinetobacter sp. YH01008]|uniref:hypothetical protein n=1 Tax=Acinetobacter TaxID=469 RepID=UPI0015D2DA4E|nr:hypothetical protein [Acinetobacter sp. YH01008]
MLDTIKKLNSVSEEEKLDFMSEINNFLIDHLNINEEEGVLEFAFHSGNNARCPGIEYCGKIYDSEDYNRIYIRFGTFGDSVNIIRKRIRIANVCFRKKYRRQNKGTELIKILYKLAVKYNYEVINVDTVNENSEPLVIKLGFSRIENLCNYHIEVTELAKYFNIDTKNECS